MGKLPINSGPPKILGLINEIKPSGIHKKILQKTFTEQTSLSIAIFSDYL